MRKLKITHNHKRQWPSLDKYFESVYRESIFKILKSNAGWQEKEEGLRKEFLGLAMSLYQFVPSNKQLEDIYKFIRHNIDDLRRLECYFRLCIIRLTKLKNDQSQPNIFLDSARPEPENYIALRSFDEFVVFLRNMGMPNFISFAENLYAEKSGYDCAKYLIDFCEKNNITQINFRVHAQHLGAKDGIENLLNDFNKKNEI